MQLTITTNDDRIVSVDVDTNESVATLKAILEAETGVDSMQQRLVFQGRELDSRATLAASGVANGDLIQLHRANATPQAAPSGGPNSQAMNPDGSAVNPQAFMDWLRGNADLRAQLQGSSLARALDTNDIAMMQESLRRVAQGRQEQEAARQREIDMLNADPFDPAVQARIAEQIQQQQINDNYEAALEHSPEVFGHILMLYVNLEVKGHPIKAFVDSGAQSTIMSVACAERCGVTHLVDKRFHGIARGVGSGKIVGRIHQAPMKVEGHHLTCSITVLESDSMEFLFGLDMLRRHQCSIDLKDNVLRFGSLGVALPFLAEHELPRHMRGMEVESPRAAAGAGPSAPGLQQIHPPVAGARPDAPPAAAAAAAAAAARAGGATPSAAAASSTPGASPVAAAGGGGGINQPDAKVARLMELGFGRQQCAEALAACGGNEELAASMLFGGF